MLMDQRATGQAIAAYLLDTTVNYMGISSPPELTERCANAAEQLIAMRPTFETHRR